MKSSEPAQAIVLGSPPNQALERTRGEAICFPPAAVAAGRSAPSR